MELNQSKNNADIPANRFTDIQRATERRNAELRATVERVHEARSESQDRTEQLIRDRRAESGDRIELSSAARVAESETEIDEARAARVEDLRAAARDGSLFDRDRLARAAERLLGAE